MGHLLSNGSYIWSKTYSFKSSPYPGQDSLQRIIIFGDMGKVVLSSDVMKFISIKSDVRGTIAFITSCLQTNMVVHVARAAHVVLIFIKCGLPREFVREL
jgi:hypothetical protein